MAESSNRRWLVVAVTGLSVGLVVAAVAFALTRSPTPLYRAHANVAMLNKPASATPTTSAKATTAARAATATPTEEPTSDPVGDWQKLNDGLAGPTAAAVFLAPEWRDKGAQAAGIDPASLTVTSTLVEGSSYITVTAQTTSGPAAEKALDALIAAAAPTIERVSGQVTTKVVQRAAGTAQPVASRAGAIAIGGFVVGGLLAAAIAAWATRPRTARRRPVPPR